MPSPARTAFDICLFKAKPQDLPISGSLVAVCALLSFIGHQISSGMLTEFTGVTSVSITQTILLGGGLWLLLAIYRKPQRWLQSAAAVFAASAITYLAALPAIMWISGSGQPLTKFSGAMFIVTAFRIWFFAIFVYILKEALEITAAKALMIALGLQMLFFMVLVSLFAD